MSLSFTNLLLVATGGFVGSGLRYSVAMMVARRWPGAGAFWSTLTVNMIGCLAIGAVAGWFEARQAGPGSGLRLLLMTGVLGGFTTFSAFALDNVELTRVGDGGMALINVLLQTVGGFVAAWVGYTLVRTWL